MDLIGNQQPLRGDAERRGDAPAVLADRFGIVARPDAAVERGIEAAGHAAPTGEEAVGDAGEPQRFRLQEFGAARRHAADPARAWNPGGGGN